MSCRRYIFVIGLVMAIIAWSAAGDLDKKLQQRVSPSFNQISLEKAVNLLARQYNLNIIISGKIAGNISLQLQDVKLEDALNYILLANGYHFITDDNVILVKPYGQAMSGELQTRVFQLKYIDGIYASKALESLISEKGKVHALVNEHDEQLKVDRSNVLIVSDLWDNLKRIETVIKSLDKPKKQVQIEVRLIETNAGGEKRVGLDLPKSVQVSMMGSETNAPITKTNTGQSGGEQTILSAWYELPAGPDQLNLGVITFDKLKATLDLLATDDHAKLISNPRVTTLNNHQAIIKIGTTVPIPEISRSISGDLYSYREKEVSVNLDVVPLIGTDGKITLHVHPIMEEIIGYTGEAVAPQPITSKREVKTTVIINDGETVVIGGLVKESETENIEKLWLLGDIPLLGRLFSHTTILKEKKDLLIFITPKIMD